jgi:hypothetical protein
MRMIPLATEKNIFADVAVLSSRALSELHEVLPELSLLLSTPELATLLLMYPSYLAHASSMGALFNPHTYVTIRQKYSRTWLIHDWAPEVSRSIIKRLHHFIIGLRGLWTSFTI